MRAGVGMMLLVAVLIAMLAFAAGQVVPGSGIAVVALLAPAWTIFVYGSGGRLMPDEVTNELIYSVLQKMQGQLASIQLKLGDMEGRLASLKEVTSSMSARIAAVEVTVSGTHKRIDRIEHRLDRLETRLGLIEA